MPVERLVYQVRKYAGNNPELLDHLRLSDDDALADILATYIRREPKLAIELESGTRLGSGLGDSPEQDELTTAAATAFFIVLIILIITSGR